MSVIFLQEGRAKRQRIKAAHTDRMTKITEKTIANKEKTVPLQRFSGEKL